MFRKECDAMRCARMHERSAPLRIVPSVTIQLYNDYDQFASLSSPRSTSLQNVTPISVLDPTTLTTVVLYPHGTPRAVGTQGALVHTTQGGIRYMAYYAQGGPIPLFHRAEAINSSKSAETILD